jgi:drug/metabolite transporter (DMT)-like permease
MLGPAFALGSSLGYGVGDFLGGTTSRRIGTLRFIFCAQLIGVVLAGGWVAFAADPVPPIGTVAAAAGAGLGLTVSLAAFFQAMAVGKMSLVAPISATGVVLPVAVGIFRGEHPSAAQVIGMVVAIAGVVLVTRTPGKPRADRIEAGLGLALLAALGIGVFLWLMAPASRYGVPWAIFVCRAIPAVVLSVVFSIRHPSLRPALQSRTASRILGQAMLGFAATTLYAFATLHGQLAIVSVLGSLYPAVTVLLAYRLLGERLGGVQQLGILAVLGGVVLLSV